MYHIYGGTKKDEYIRSAELFEELCRDQSPFFAVYFILDIGYTIEDLKQIVQYIIPRPKWINKG